MSQDQSVQDYIKQFTALKSLYKNTNQRISLNLLHRLYNLTDVSAANEKNIFAGLNYITFLFLIFYINFNNIYVFELLTGSQVLFRKLIRGFQRYCKMTKEGRCEWYQSNHYDFAYNRRCFEVHLKG